MYQNEKYLKSEIDTLHKRISILKNRNEEFSKNPSTFKDYRRIKEHISKPNQKIFILEDEKENPIEPEISTK